jgi:glutamate N-acetyltransferase/amino-acid N-acetyltransferase
MQPIKKIELATINCGLKYKNRDDLLLIKLPKNTAVAGVFTKSSMAAAPVKWCRENIIDGRVRALIVNAGNANAFTGLEGKKAIGRIVNTVGEDLHCKPQEVLMSSTGVIGERLKDELITAAIPKLSKKLSENKEAWNNAAKAIMTTDTFAKTSHKIIKIDGREVTINGFAKGSGMIAPNMATMLGYIFTDANICAKLMQKVLSVINEETFNSITVDSDTSTNDTVLLFATKSSTHKEIKDDDDKNLIIFKEALKELMLDLAKQIVIDGEGAKKLIEIEVIGAKSKSSAKAIGLSVANSPLVKTAIAGSDPNWGRIIMAIGKSGQVIKPEKIGIKIGEFSIIENGKLINNYDEKPIYNYLKEKEIKIIIQINLSEEEKENLQHTAKVWGCDLNEEYIKINKDYRS